MKWRRFKSWLRLLLILGVDLGVILDVVVGVVVGVGFDNVVEVDLFWCLRLMIPDRRSAICVIFAIWQSSEFWKKYFSKFSKKCIFPIYFARISVFLRTSHLLDDDGVRFVFRCGKMFTTENFLFLMRLWKIFIFSRLNLVHTVNATYFNHWTDSDHNDIN